MECERSLPGGLPGAERKRPHRNVRPKDIVENQDNQLGVLELQEGLLRPEWFDQQERVVRRELAHRAREYRRAHEGDAHPFDPEGRACRVDEGVGSGAGLGGLGRGLVGRRREWRVRVGDPQERDVADGLDPATNAEGRGSVWR